ncbi:MAG: serine/threonine-protein kinase [Polyangiaceae bacterium]
MALNQQRYRVLNRIAAGGMAEVFRAESAGVEGFKKTVAIKRVLPHLAEKKQFIGMFLDEARLSAHLSHSNCVQVFDIGVGDNTFFIVMEYVDGADLKGLIEHQRKQNKPFPLQEACLICLKICEGLEYAHTAKDSKGRDLHIVHRDMSPPNVLITRYGEVKIVDFGLAKANSQLEKSEPGIIKGKFGYLSPEAAYGRSVDLRTDVFAVGIILWEMLAGRRLFLGETDLETVRQVQAANIPPISKFNPFCNRDVEAVLAKVLARDPEQRYQSARDLGRDLSELMYRAGRAASSFDIADLLAPVVTQRDNSRAEKLRDRGTLIGTLIEEALFEFTSIEKGRETSTMFDARGTPISLGSFENQTWASDIGELSLGSTDTLGNTSEGSSIEIGNLAALEEDAPVVVSPGAQAAFAKPHSSRPALDAVAPKPKRTGFIIAIVLLVIGLLVAGLYVSGAFGSKGIAHKALHGR